MAEVAAVTEEDLINEIASEQQELCDQAKDYRRCSLAERISRATAYRVKQLRRWDERCLPILQNIVDSKERKATLVKFNGSYSLIDASSRDDVEEVRALLEEGADPNSVNFDGLSALHQCCIEDSPEIAQILIDYGADVNLRDNEWWTPLHAAASCGLEHIVELLLGNSASVAVLNSDGDLPIDMADTSAIFDLLKDAQLDQGYSDEDIAFHRYELEEKMTSDLKKGIVKVSDRDRVQATPLHVAAAHGLDKVAEFLLQAGADVNAKDVDDWTPAHAAACWGHASLLATLAKYGANFDARTKNYDTPYSLTEDAELQEVIMDLKLKAVEKLSSRKANRGKRMTTSSRGQSVKRSTLERKKSLSRHEAKNEAIQRVQAQQQMENSASDVPSADNTDSRATIVDRLSAATNATVDQSHEPSLTFDNAARKANDGDTVEKADGLTELPHGQQRDAIHHQQSSTTQLMPTVSKGRTDQSQSEAAVGTSSKEKSCCTIL